MVTQMKAENKWKNISSKTSDGKDGGHLRDLGIDLDIDVGIDHN